VVFEAVQVLTWFAFAIDYVVRLVISHERTRFLRHHILDLAAVLLPVLRPLRVLSIVFLSTRKLSKVLKNRVITYVAVTAIAVWFVAGLAVTDVERLAVGSNIHDVWEGWWWAFITMATVGYGDVFPVTIEGRLVAVALVVTGITLIGTITAYIAAWFAEARREAEAAIISEIDTAEDKIDRLSREVKQLKALVEQLVEEKRQLKP
jgi:voltage-gated potassium channel